MSTDQEEQTSSYELQQNEFTDRINANPNWELAGIYADEGISGTELSHRKGMLGFGNFQLVRAAFFPSNAYPSMTISNGKLRFNTACLKKFEDVEYVHPADHPLSPAQPPAVGGKRMLRSGLWG